MATIRRRPVQKKRAARQFNHDAERTHEVNVKRVAGGGLMRGGYRL